MSILTFNNIIMASNQVFNSKHLFAKSLVILLLVICSCSSPDCKNKKNEYLSGFGHGEAAKTMSMGSSAKTYVDKYNAGLGRKAMEATDCFCDGFSDGYSKKEKKY